jgi:four helix bundle protein
METQQIGRGLALAEKTFQWTLRMRAVARSAYSDRFILSQIQNAALSAHLNLAEGHKSVYPAEQLKFYSTARGSVAEALAGMDVLVAEGRVPRTTADELHATGAEVSRMLWGLMKTRMKK